MDSLLNRIGHALGDAQPMWREWRTSRVLRVHAYSWDAKGTRPGWDACIRRARPGPTHVFSAVSWIVCCVDDEAVGCIRLVRVSDSFLLSSVYVEPFWRGHGIGFTLLACARQHAGPVRCTISKNDRSAVTVLARHGIKATSSRAHFNFVLPPLTSTEHSK